MGKRGRKRDLDRELQYWDLLASGVGAVEACRQVGVSRKTGYRWRAEMGGVIAKKRAPQSGRYRSLFERQRIASLHERGHGVREIARRIGRSTSTVSRELDRNTEDWDDGYDPVVAHLRAHERAKRPKRGKICEYRLGAAPAWSDSGQGVTEVSCVRFVGQVRCSTAVRAGQAELTS